MIDSELRDKYEVVIGLEIHAELATKSKMFCGSDNHSPLTTPANLHICEICAGEPGTLPVLNKQAIDWTIKTGLAMNCQIANLTKWDRKQYFYPDLPKGYQISQYEQPVAYDGYLTVLDGSGKEKKIRITRIHLEEDTGKLTHPAGKLYSLVDFNRAGTPLMELVTEPDVRSAIEAKNFAREYQRILRAIGVSNADMEKGEMRVEANISVRKRVESQKSKVESSLGTKVEVKNLNSFKAVERAIEFETERQIETLEDGGELVQETRGWDDSKGRTYSQRVKESSADYRYFGEPDLPEVEFAGDYIKNIESALASTPLPAERRRELVAVGLSPAEADTLIDSPRLAELFDLAVAKLGPKHAKKIAGLILTELIGYARSQKRPAEEYKFKPSEFIGFAQAIIDEELTSRLAKEVLPELFEKGGEFRQILAARGLSVLNDDGAIEKAVEIAITANSKAVSDYKAGRESALTYLTGQVMAATRGQADPTTVRKILKKKL